MAKYPPTTDEPVGWAVMRQEWNRLTFVHWAMDPAVVQARLPEGCSVDVFEGSAWVGLVAFHMENIGVGRGPGVPYLGSFPETNVRTYVRGPDGRPGVWFDSLDVSRLAPALVARVTYGLPYMWSNMSIDLDQDPNGALGAGTFTYDCRRRWGGPSASSRVVAKVDQPIPAGQVSPLERFLTCRWGLYSEFAGKLMYAPVEHPEWPLYRAELHELKDSLITAAGYPEPAGEPLVHWSPGVAVRIARPRRVQLPKVTVPTQRLATET